MQLRLSTIALTFLLIHSGAAYAEVHVSSNSTPDEVQLQLKLIQRAQEREVGKKFHDETVRPKEEIIKFMAQRDQIKVQENNRLREVMSQPPPGFPRNNTNSQAPTSGASSYWPILLALVILCGVLLAAWFVKRNKNPMPRPSIDPEPNQRTGSKVIERRP
jgi:hypothetical protein